MLERGRDVSARASNFAIVGALTLFFALQASVARPVQDAYARATRMYLDNEMNGLMTLCMQQLKTAPSAKWYDLMLCSMARYGAYPQTDKVVEGAQKLAPDDAHLKATCALALAKAGDVSNCIDYAVKAVSMAPTDARAHAILGYCLMKLGRDKGAVAEIEESVKLQPKDFETHLIVADYYMETLKEKSAMESFDSAVAANPNCAYCAAQRGSFKLYSGDPEGGVADATRAIQLNPKYLDAYKTRATAYRQMKRYPQAARDFTLMIGIAPVWASYNDRSQCYEDMRQYPEAIEDMSKAILNLNPGFDPSRFDKRALRKDSHYLGYWIKRARMYKESGQLDRAIADLDQVIQAKPEHMEALSLHQMCCREEGRWNEAAADLTKLLALDPQSVEWYSVRASVYKKWGKPERRIMISNI